MGAVLAVTLPVFLLIGAGYLAVWRGLLSEPHVEGLMQFTQKFAIPCLLFGALADLDLAAGFDARLLASYYSGSFVVFVTGALGARWFFGRDAEDAVAIGFVAMFANTVLLGLPITERAYGVSSLTSNYAIIALHAVFCYFIGITTMETIKARKAVGGVNLLRLLPLVFGAMFRNALMIGVALGVLVNLSGLSLPAPIQEGVDLMTRAALPAALFALGGILVRYRPEGDLRTIAYVCFLSLLVHPSVTYGMGQALGLEDSALRAAVMTAAMAPGVNAYLFSAMYGRAMRVSASSVLLGTAALVLTASGWLLILGH